MSELYLIAHKVRGEPAFDVAIRMECPECPEGTDQGFCAECDGTGYWWIIPTSGHRAYPWWDLPINFYNDSDSKSSWGASFYLNKGPNQPAAHWDLPDMPSNLPDHYTTRADPSRPKLSDLFKPKPFTMNRRI